MQEDKLFTRRKGADQLKGWWCNQPGYVDDPSTLLATSIRLRKKTQEEPVTRSARFLRPKKMTITPKITSTQYEAAIGNQDRQPQIKRWTDAVFHFSLPENVQNQMLLDKYDLSFKKPLDSSFTHDKIFHEERIKGATSTIQTVQQVDPYAIDKSKKTTRKRIVDCTHRRKKLDEFKLANGVCAPSRTSKRRTIRFQQVAAQEEQLVHFEDVEDSQEKKEPKQLHIVREPYRVRTGGFDPVCSMEKLQLH